MLRLLKLLWVAPITLIACVPLAFIKAFGGSVNKHGIAWEATGGLAPRLLWLMNPWAHIEAITLGHIIIAQDMETASRMRTHEQVHVRQYERWGALFPFAYVVASGIALLKGGDAYRDNMFEREAFLAGPFVNDSQRY
jgi:hypothetical protein